VSHAGFTTSDVGGLERLQTAANGIMTPVGPGAPGPVNSRDPPVMKKVGTPGGAKALPVEISQP
jgi:hypothetical protein